MFKHRLLSACATGALCASLVVPAGCKKKEEPKAPEAAPAATATGAAKTAEAPAAPAAPAIPVLPDVELVAGEGIAGWVSFKSIAGLFDVVEAIGGKMGELPPGGAVRQGALDQLTTMLAGAGVTGHDWIDKTRPLHVVFQDDGSAAAAPGAAPGAAPAAPPAPADMAGGAFVVLPVTDKDSALKAMAAAKKGPEAEGHEAMIQIQGKPLYIDFLDKYAVLTISKDRFGKAKGFAERIAKVDPPSLVYVGVSIEDLAKTRQKEIEGFLSQLETMPGMAGPAGANVKAMQMYTKMIKGWVTDLQRFEILVHADVNATKAEMRMTAKAGSKLDKQLSAGKGRTPKEIANLLPSNSYLTFAASMDPAPSIEAMDEQLVPLQEMLKLEQKDYDAFVADIKAAAKLQDGNSAMGVYPDGAAALGLLVVAGTTDGETAVKLTKRVVAGILGKVLADEVAKKKAANPNDPQLNMLAIVEQALKEQKIDPILKAFGPAAAEKGVTLTASTTKDGDATCDTLDVAVDYSKMGTPEAEAAQVKAVMGDKTAVSLCWAKSKLSMAVGPGALEKGKGAALSKAGGLNDAPIYKATTEKDAGASWVLYANPGAALAAFKGLGPQVPSLPADRAVTMVCQNRTKSYGCALEVPVDLIVAVKNLVKPAAPAPGAMPPPAGAPGPTGAPAAGAQAPAPAAP